MSTILKNLLAFPIVSLKSFPISKDLQNLFRLRMEVKERGDLEVQLYEQKRANEQLMQCLEHERKESINKDIRLKESWRTKEQELETAQSTIIVRVGCLYQTWYSVVQKFGTKPQLVSLCVQELQNRVSLLVEDFQNQEENARQV